MRDEQAEKQRILFVSGTEGDTRRYRCFHHQEQLALRNIHADFRESVDPQLPVDVLNYDLFVLHRVPYSPLIGIVIDLAHLQGKPVIFETDDFVFAPELYEQIGYVDTLSPENARRFRRNLKRQAETFERCDCVLTTTGFLAEEAVRRGKPAYVHRNAPSHEMIHISEQAFAHRQRQMKKVDENRPLVVAYFSGTGSHNRDFSVITDPLIWILEKYPQVWLHISGHLELGAEFAPFHSRIRRAPYVDWRELPYLIARSDVNLAPLEPENLFCQAKSENKFVEAALVGVPTIASRIDAYEYVIEDGENGFLASTVREWKVALQKLLNDSAERKRLGTAAQRTVYARYTPEQQAPHLVKTFQEIVERYSAQATSPERILWELADGMQEYAAWMEGRIQSQEAKLTSLRQVLDRYEDQLVRREKIIEREREIVQRKNEVIARRDEVIKRKDEVIKHKDDVIKRKDDVIRKLEQRIKDIMQGRVMRLMTTIQRWFRGK